MNAIVMGRRRQGKSTLALRLCRTYHQTVFVWDPNNQFSALPESTDDIQELREWIDDESLEHGVIVFRPRPGELEDDFTDLVDVIWPLGNYALLVDEASTVQRPQLTHPKLELLMRQAPRDGAVNTEGASLDVSVVQTSHRPADINSLCRALATDSFLFQVSLRRDLDVIEAQHGADVAAVLPTLQQWHVCHTFQGNDGRQHYATWTEPADWYAPISATG
jgi:hypothetical protein